MNRCFGMFTIALIMVAGVLATGCTTNQYTSANTLRDGPAKFAQLYNSLMLLRDSRHSEASSIANIQFIVVIGLVSDANSIGGLVGSLDDTPPAMYLTYFSAKEVANAETAIVVELDSYEHDSNRYGCSMVAFNWNGQAWYKSRPPISEFERSIAASFVKSIVPSKLHKSGESRKGN